ncbi:C1 family peptidase [Variovorax sp. PvP013]|uniref:C1 family peptidase n=1 Tax=Variovorax sp. PvP013 TaxID=3156435 RepID=UPI003D25C60B
MRLLMHKGDAGEDVDALARSLRRELGADAAPFDVLGRTGAAIDADFDAAIRRWQAGVGLVADGIVGPRCQVLLALIDPPGDAFGPYKLNVGRVSRLFPATKPANIARYLPYVEAALGVAGLTDAPLVLGALATIRAETEGFVPISEFPSGFNTRPGDPPFSAYDKRLGNRAGEGGRFRGRGFVQLTGRTNYEKYGQRIGLPLIDQPELANAPEVAAVLLAEFLADHAASLRDAVAQRDHRAARRLVNGGAHGLERFRDVFDRAGAVFEPPPSPALAGAGAGVAASRRPAESRSRLSHTRRDSADLRDRPFMPQALGLPAEHPSQEVVRTHLPAYAAAGLILNQGREGACTGFGLTCVINYLRWIRPDRPAGFASVSPRMLYTLARRHDEYEGEDYEGSSCRGALKGWFHNGVCLEEDWPYAPESSNPARYGFATRATQITLGVYYRIDTASITDLQAAIAQHGAIFVSAFTHDGWDRVASVDTDAPDHASLPRIAFDGRPSTDGGHAFALVGFNADGFLLQNSWGREWGAGGFAVLTYLDWLANGMDAWVVALGVPGVVGGRLAVARNAQGARAGADRGKWWDAGLAYQHSVVLGNDGRVARYLTEDEQPRKLQQQAYVLPDQWFRSQPADEPKRLVIYAHGGLNDEAAAIRRVSAMGRFFIGNGCYPIFLVWKTGLLESIRDILADAGGRRPAAVGAGERLSDLSDLAIERTIGRPLARPIWSEMKENAGLAFAPRHGGELLLDAITALAATWGPRFELHLVGHSAGSILLGHMITAMSARGDAVAKRSLASVGLFAPACTVAFANQHYARDDAVMKRLSLDVLSDEVERADTVARIYRKSLLYLVSNALEADLRTPILGLQRIDDPDFGGWDGSSDTGEALANWRRAAVDARLARRTRVVTAPRIRVATDPGTGDVLQPSAHGGFDNDIDVLARTLMRITGAGELATKVDDLRGY